MDFSIVIPAKNEERNIAACLDSIRALHFDSRRFEILVVDNGSTDATVAIAEGRNARVWSKPGLTISGLRNWGASQSQGKVLAFLDADCTVPPDWLQMAGRYLDDEHIVCFGSPPIVPDAATWVQQSWFRVRRKPEMVQEVDWFESMNMFVRRSAFEASGGFDESLVTCEDYDFSLKLKKLGTLLCDSRIIAIHHGEAATVGHFFRKERWRATGNFKGLLQHGIEWKELPSLMAPLGHCLLLIALLLAIIFRSATVSLILAGVLLFWQGLLLAISYRKCRPVEDWVRVVQLYWLLNIYFTARGLAVLQGNRR